MGIEVMDRADIGRAMCAVTPDELAAIGRCRAAAERAAESAAGVLGHDKAAMVLERVADLLRAKHGSARH